MIEFFKPGKLVRIMKKPSHSYTDPDGWVSYKSHEGEMTVDTMGNLIEGAPVDAKWSDDRWIIANANLRVARYRERMEEFVEEDDFDDY